MTSVPEILFEAQQATSPSSTRQEVVKALEQQQPDRNINYEHALRRVERWEAFLHGGQPFHAVPATTYLALQLAMREFYLHSVDELPFKWIRAWMLRL